MTLSPTRKARAPRTRATPAGLSAACNAWLSATAPAGPRFIGVSTWMSRTGSSPNRSGIRDVTSSITVARALSGSRRSTMKKSAPAGASGASPLAPETGPRPLAPETGISPSLMRCALTPMRVRDDEASSRLAKELSETHAGNDPGIDDVAQDRARPHARELIHVAPEQQSSAGRDGLRERVGRGQVEHRRLVDDHSAGFDRTVPVPLERGRLGIEV